MTFTITIELEDETAIRIIQNLPESERDRIIEKYLILGDTVLRYAQVTTSEASLQNFLKPMMHQLDTTVVQLNQLHAHYNTLLVGHQETLQKHQQTLDRVLPVLTTSSTRGAVTNEAVFQALQQGFRTDTITDVSSKSKYTDITATILGTHHEILIELKDWTTDVASAEVEKFWRDMEVRKAKVGCFVSMNTKIQTVTSDFCIETKGAQIGIFVVNTVFGHQGYILAYAMARQFEQLLESQSAAPNSGKVDLIAKVINNQLMAVKDEIATLAKLKSDVDKVRDQMSKDLGRVSEKMDKLRERVENIVSDVLRDFACELTE